MSNLKQDVSSFFNVAKTFKENLEFLTISNLSVDYNREISKLKLIQIYSCKDYFFSSCSSVVSFLMLMTILFILKPKMYKAIKALTFALFCITCIKIWAGYWVYGIFLIFLSGDVEYNPKPRRNSNKSFFNLPFSIACALTSIQSCFFKSINGVSQIWHNLFIRNMSRFQCCIRWWQFWILII